MKDQDLNLISEAELHKLLLSITNEVAEGDFEAFINWVQTVRVDSSLITLLLEGHGSVEITGTDPNEYQFSLTAKGIDYIKKLSPASKSTLN